MKRKKKKAFYLIIFFLIIILIPIFLIIYYYINEVKTFDSLEDEVIKIERYYIYGTHFNIEAKLEKNENINEVKIIFISYNGQKIEYDCKFEQNNNYIKIYTSDKINKGIDLESINEGRYNVFFKILYDDNQAKYYSIQNNTQYNDLEYYTITKEGTNNKIDIKFKDISRNNKKISYLNILCKKSKLPEKIYDISIDPGHGGSDPGAVNGKYKEAEIAMEYGISLKMALEELGIKVILTRDGNEDTSEKSRFNVYSIYDKDGRVNIVGKSKVKYNLSIHLNSLDVNTISGTEVYAPPNTDLTMAQLLADNIVKIAKTTYSTREVDKVSNGVYIRNFTDTEINNSINNANNMGYTPYNITKDTPYLYMIREIGGAITGAYVDGRNKKYGKNEYYNSNIGVESYLIELGYINNKKDLDNMLKNKELYIEAIKNTVKEYIFKSETQ